MFWDKRFAAEGKIWGDEPSVTAWRAASLFTAHGAQSALVLGCGYGRIISAIRTWRHISPASRSCSPRLSMSRKITHRMARICTSYGPWLFVAPLESLALSPAPVAAGCELTGASVAYINGIGPSNVPTRRSGAVRQEGLGMPSPSCRNWIPDIFSRPPRRRAQCSSSRGSMKSATNLATILFPSAVG